MLCLAMFRRGRLQSNTILEFSLSESARLSLKIKIWPYLWSWFWFSFRPFLYLHGCVSLLQLWTMLFLQFSVLSKITSRNFAFIPRLSWSYISVRIIPAHADPDAPTGRLERFLSVLCIMWQINMYSEGLTFSATGRSKNKINSYIVECYVNAFGIGYFPYKKIRIPDVEKAISE